MGKHFKRDEEKITTGMIIAGIICIAILVTTLIIYLIKTGVDTISSEDDYIKEEDLFGDIEYEEDEEELEIVSTQMGKTVDEAENTLAQNNTSTNATSSNTTKENTTNTTTKNETNTSNSNNTTNSSIEETEEVKFTSPIKGEILREFASDSLVYSDTLQEWVTHNGVDIKADKTTVVTAAEKGTIYAIKNDPRYGLTVIINHADGYQTVYANLLTAEYVVEGEEVEAGQTIGTVGNSATFEIADEYHLHFELIKDNEYLNPMNFMSFE